MEGETNFGFNLSAAPRVNAPLCPSCSEPLTRESRRGKSFVPSAGGEKFSYVCDNPQCPIKKEKEGGLVAESETKENPRLDPKARVLIANAELVAAADKDKLDQLLNQLSPGWEKKSQSSQT